MAEALARAGDVDQAEAIAGSITDPSVQAEALAGVAEALAESVMWTGHVRSFGRPRPSPVPSPPVLAGIGAGGCGGGAGRGG